MSDAQDLTTKEKILTAALDEFARKGYRAATVRSICDAAGVNVAAINYHFSDKSELYRRTLMNLLERCTNDLHLPRLEGKQPPEAVAEALRNWLFALFIQQTTDPHDVLLLKLRISLREMLEPSGFIDERVREFWEDNFSSLRSIIAAGIRAEVPKNRLDMLMFFMYSQHLFYFFNRRVVCWVSETDHFLTKNIDEIIAMIVRAVINEIAWLNQEYQTENCR